MRLPLLLLNSEIIIEYAHFTYKSKDIFIWKDEQCYHHDADMRIVITILQILTTTKCYNLKLVKISTTIEVLLIAPLY